MSQVRRISLSDLAIGRHQAELSQLPPEEIKRRKELEKRINLAKDEGSE